jgi:hypothetical protein
MGADEVHEGYLPAEVEGGDQAIIPSGNLEPDALTVQHLGSRRRALNLVHGRPMCGDGCRRCGWRRTRIVARRSRGAERDLQERGCIGRVRV